MREFNFYIVRNGEIVYRTDSEEEAIEIIQEDETGELEFYTKDAKLPID